MLLVLALELACCEYCQDYSSQGCFFAVDAEYAIGSGKRSMLTSRLREFEGQGNYVDRIITVIRARIIVRVKFKVMGRA